MDGIEEENENGHLSWKIPAPETSQCRIVLLPVCFHHSAHKNRCSEMRGTLQEKQLSFLW